MGRQVLENRQKMLGPQHPDTLMSMETCEGSLGQKHNLESVSEINGWHGLNPGSLAGHQKDDDVHQ